MSIKEIDAAVYQRAERMMLHHRQELVFGDKVKPHWIEDGKRFWYVSRTPDGKQFILVDPATGSREPAFDHARLAESLATASGQEVDADRLPFSAIEFTGDERADESDDSVLESRLEFDAFEAHWRCDTTTYDLEKVTDHRQPDMAESVSPDGKLAVFRRGHDLWARSLPDGREWALTTDGVADYDYGVGPDAMEQVTMLRQLGIEAMPPAVAWSPDSTRVLTHRTDQRGVREVSLVDSMPVDGGAPTTITKRYAFPGDETIPHIEYVVITIDSASSDKPAIVSADTEPLAASLLSPIAVKAAWWDETGSAIYFFRQSRDIRTLALHHLDPGTGAVTTMVTESGPTLVEPNQYMGQKPIIAALSDRNEILWYSQRDGWGHLYRYDGGTGELINQVTSGSWAVREILWVDSTAQLVYFVASGLVAENPYRRTVCRVNLDGTGFTRLTDDDLDHVVAVPESPANESPKYFVDTASTNDIPPVITARDGAGKVLVELERADISRLVETGWRAPEQFSATADDGETIIHGVLYLPPDFDPSKRYPVVDSPYPGPQTNRVTPDFQPGFFGPLAESVAALGFVVVAVDGRGTPGRDKAFHDASYGRLSDAGCLADHIAAMRELAATRPWMDLDRVGIFGLSGGGYATFRAMVDFPDFYRVGVSICGNHENRYYHLAWAETYDGPSNAETWVRSSNVEQAAKLDGHLLLIHGGSDDNVMPYHTFRLAQALMAAEKEFELCIVPGAGHPFLGYEHILGKRMWDFLVRNLLDARPPADYRIAPAPLNLELVASYFE